MATSGDANNKKFDVFLSHRGPDVKNTIASCLYYWLRDRSPELQVFLDRQELEGGLILETQIKEAIASASVCVAIFSPGYAESRWCLEELYLMTVSGKPIIPIFYQVKPADLRGARDRKGAYAADLAEHERKIRDGQSRYNYNTVLNWRNALYKAADFSGFDLETLNGDWGVLLLKVVECVFKRVGKLSSYEMRHRSGGILDTVKAIGMHDQLRALGRALGRMLLNYIEWVPRPGRMLLNYIEWVPRPWRGIEKITVLSHDMKGLQMIVLKVELDCVKCQKIALMKISRVEGVDSIAINVKDMTLTVIGSADPVCLTASLRKLGRAGPARGRRVRALNSRLSFEPSLLQGKRGN